ncbi:glycerate kinase [Acinetobacter sp. ANC 3791]|uniref:glycerate kinase family protein n=1 Tax=Acinetobacter sp. ANC 3791 TaxID=2529836 RepID=UPI001039C0C1|nr:glycerate kinase [Acinetobacter sp. ANC 3791]TCB85781.1 glycerate kinase [Acinetobacter sp. ANC 3791]
MPKTFVLAPDSFKESMTAQQACQAMQRGIIKIFPDAHFIHVPMADGGEGTVDALLLACGGQCVEVTVSGSLPEQKVATYFALIDQGKTAVIEMAKANGLDLLPVELRNPLLTSTFGTGEMIRAALDYQVDKIIIGLGGSATNDAGAGMAQALGVRFYDAQEQELPIGLAGGQLQQVHQIDLTALDSRLQHTQIWIASDVTNPLTGLNGASAVFAPQKGADADMVQQLDANLQHFAKKIQQDCQIQVANVAGAGAAGGLAAGLMAFTGANLHSGVDLVIEQTQLAKHIAQADYVFTGEGGIDFQTKFGKTPLGVAKVTRQFNKPLFACAGYVGEEIDELYDKGFTAIFGILDRCCDLTTACQHGQQNLERTCENIARILKNHN